MAAVVRVAAVQAEPRWFDLDAGVEQIVNLIGEAAAGGAELVAFPEVFLPGYPWWIWLDSPAWGMRFVARYAENSMARDGAQMARTAAAAADHRVFVVLGFTERSATGSLYMAQAIIDDAGQVIAVRRKLKPTHAERSVFGEGDGSDIRVHDTRLGRLGALNCAEHIQPLEEDRARSEEVTVQEPFRLGAQEHPFPDHNFKLKVSHATCNL
jgi:aliphatic nitrilase